MTARFPYVQARQTNPIDKCSLNTHLTNICQWDFSETSFFLYQDLALWSSIIE